MDSTVTPGTMGSVHERLNQALRATTETESDAVAALRERVKEMTRELDKAKRELEEVRRNELSKLEGIGIIRKDAHDHTGVYYGGRKAGKMHGQGILRYRTGCVYEGEFLDDAKHGHGVYHGVHHGRYEGHWANGKRDGNGVNRLHNGDVMSLKYEKGVMVYGIKWTGDGRRAKRLRASNEGRNEWEQISLQEAEATVKLLSLPDPGNRGPLHCTVCSKAFLTMDSLVAHEKTHGFSS